MTQQPPTEPVSQSAAGPSQDVGQRVNDLEQRLLSQGRFGEVQRLQFFRGVPREPLFSRWKMGIPIFPFTNLRFLGVKQVPEGVIPLRWDNMRLRYDVHERGRMWGLFTYNRMEGLFASTRRSLIDEIISGTTFKESLAEIYLALVISIDYGGDAGDLARISGDFRGIDRDNLVEIATRYPIGDNPEVGTLPRLVVAHSYREIARLASDMPYDRTIEEEADQYQAISRGDGAAQEPYATAESGELDRQFRIYWETLQNEGRRLVPGIIVEDSIVIPFRTAQAQELTETLDRQRRQADADRYIEFQRSEAEERKAQADRYAIEVVGAETNRVLEEYYKIIDGYLKGLSDSVDKDNIVRLIQTGRNQVDALKVQQEIAETEARITAILAEKGLPLSVMYRDNLGRIGRFGSNPRDPGIPGVEERGS